MKTMTRRLGLQIMAGAAAAPATATTASLANPDAELIELGRRFVELARHRDAVNDESGRLYDIASSSYPPGTVYEARSLGAAAEAAYTAAIDAADEAVGLSAVVAEFEETTDQLRAIFARMVTIRPTTIEGMRAIASMVLNFEWDGNNVEFAEGTIEGAALAVLVAGLLDKPLPERLPDWAAAWI
ncbi:hypothetical protein V5279_24405 [Bradyrhizobium sp. 26S5]|uniref:hypothetical protein n=1 Tax=Bradyrhizobium sp. 26S5 TaxID=3139729 RepID=UPI0030D0CBC2